MNCENALCIYNEDMICSLDEIYLNSCGMCTDCIIPNIPQEILQSCKKIAIKRLKEI